MVEKSVCHLGNTWVECSEEYLVGTKGGQLVATKALW